MAEIRWGVDISKVPPPVRDSLEPITRFFSYHDAHPVALTFALMEKFGLQWIVWEETTLRREILETFKATSISENNWNKIRAVRVINSNSACWHEWHVFEKIIQALNNNVPRFDIAQRCTVAQLMAGVDILNAIDKRTFGDDIEKYVAASAVEEGLTYLPEPLDFAQGALSWPMYECLDCGNVDTYDMDDDRCDFCVGRFQGEHPLDGKPQPNVHPEAGRKIKKFLKRDPGPAKDRFMDFKANRSLEMSDEVPEDVQAVKLMVAYEYMLLRRKQLVEQLKELKSWITN